MVENFKFDPDFTMKDATNPHLYFYIQAGKSMGLEITQFSKSTMALFKKGKRQFFISRAETPLNNYVSAQIAGKKERTNKILKLNNIPVPESKKVNNIKELSDIYDKLNHSIVIKPDQGIAGRGITILPSKNELEKAWRYCNNYRNEGNVVVEEFIKGRDYRILVLGNKAIAVARRVPANILGNGKDTTEALITKKNNKRKKSGMSKITIDEELKRRLKNEGYGLYSVPPTKQIIYLRYNSNMSTGGTTEECMKETHPYYLKLAVNACKAIGLKFGGVDLITPDITDPTIKHGINEINRAPGLRIHYFPNKGLPQNVAKQVIKAILANI